MSTSESIVPPIVARRTIQFDTYIYNRLVKALKIMTRMGAELNGLQEKAQRFDRTLTLEDGTTLIDKIRDLDGRLTALTDVIARIEATVTKQYGPTQHVDAIVTVQPMTVRRKTLYAVIIWLLSWLAFAWWLKS